MLGYYRRAGNTVSKLLRSAWTHADDQTIDDRRSTTNALLTRINLTRWVHHSGFVVQQDDKVTALIRGPLCVLKSVVPLETINQSAGVFWPIDSGGGKVGEIKWTSFTQNLIVPVAMRKRYACSYNLEWRFCPLTSLLFSISDRIAFDTTKSWIVHIFSVWRLPLAAWSSPC